MSASTWIVVAGDSAIGNLIETARSLGMQVTAAVVGPRAVADTVAAGGVDKVLWFGEPDQAPVEAFATAVADAIEANPGVVLGASRASDRVLLGAVAARLQAPVLTAPSAVKIEGDNLVVTRSTFAGIAEETVTVAGPVVVILHIAPGVYFAIGISGQLQHMVGVRGAKTIVAINSDPNALVFKEADYCLVGDLYKIVPALTDALK